MKYGRELSVRAGQRGEDLQRHDQVNDKGQAKEPEQMSKESD